MQAEVDVNLAVPVSKGRKAKGRKAKGRNKNGAMPPPPPPADATEKQKPVVYSEPVLRSKSKKIPRPGQRNVQRFNEDSAEEQRKCTALLRVIRRTAPRPDRPASENNKLRDCQKASRSRVVDHMHRTINALLSHCNKVESKDMSDEEKEEGLLQEFDKWRWLINDSTPRSGKSLERSAMRFHSPYAIWVELTKKLPLWAAAALCVQPRVAYLTKEVAHKSEILKEGLDKTVFGTSPAATKKLKDVKMCMREDGLGLDPNTVFDFADRTYDPKVEGDFNLDTFAESWQLVSTNQRMVNDIADGYVRIGDFFEITLEEWHLHTSPAERPKVQGKGWALIAHTFRSSWMVGVTGTPAEWALSPEDGGKGWHPHYLGADEKPIVPYQIATCSYGDLFIERHVCRVNFVTMRIEKVVTLVNGQHLDLAGPLTLDQQLMARYSPDIWCLFAAFNMNFVIQKGTEVGFIQQGLWYTPMGRREEQELDGRPLTAEEKMQDKELPAKLYAAVTNMMKKSPTDFIHWLPCRNGAQVTLDYAASSEGAASNKEALHGFIVLKTTDFMISDNICRVGVDNETVIATADMACHRLGVISSMGKQKQTDCRATNAITGNSITRTACRAQSCEGNLDAYLLTFSTPAANGKPPPQDCWNFHPMTSPDAELIARRNMAKAGALNALVVTTDTISTHESQVITLMEDTDTVEDMAGPSGYGVEGEGHESEADFALMPSTPVHNPNLEMSAPVMTQVQHELAANTLRTGAAQEVNKQLQTGNDDVEKLARQLTQAKQRQARLEKFSRGPVEKFIAADTKMTVALLQKTVYMFVVHPNPVTNGALESNQTIEYTLWGSDNALTLGGEPIPEDSWSIMPCEYEMLEDDRRIGFQVRVDPSKKAFRVRLEMTEDGRNPVPYDATAIPVTKEIYDQVAMLEKAKDQPQVPKLIRWSKVARMSGKVKQDTQKAIDKTLLSEGDAGERLINEIFMHSVCKSDHPGMRSKATALCEDEGMGSKFQDHVDCTRSAMWQSAQLRYYFVGPKALEANADAALWPSIPRNSAIDDVVDSDPKALDQEGDGGLRPTSCTIDAFFQAAPSGTYEKLAEMRKEYTDKVREETCDSSYELSSEDEDERGQLMEDDTFQAADEVDKSTSAVLVPTKRKYKAKAMSSRIASILPTEKDECFQASPATCLIAKSIGKIPVNARVVQVEQKANGNLVLPTNGYDATSVRQGPAPAPDPNAPVPINRVVAVHNKTVSSVVEVDKHVVGYKLDVRKFFEDVEENQLNVLTANPPLNGKSISQMATGRAKDACRRLTIGVSSIVSSRLEAGEAVPNLHTMLNLSDKDIAKHLVKYHGPRDANKKKSNLVSDVTRAFAQFRSTIDTGH